MDRVQKPKMCSLTNSEVSASDPDDPLEIHSRKIINAITTARKATQQLLRKKIKELREDLEYGESRMESPLHTFPEEIWRMIFDRVKVTDLVSCAKTCFLFNTLINLSDQELLFGKVLPILFSYLWETDSVDGEYDPKTGIEILVKCGRVCKKWRGSVDCFADSYFCVNRPTPCGVQKLVKEPVPSFDNKHMLYKPFRYNIWQSFLQGYLFKRDRQLKIGINPFLTCASTTLSEILERNALSLLKGNVIWKLDLKVNQIEPNTSGHVLSQCTKAIQNLPKLKSLRLSRLDCTPAEIQQTETQRKISHPHLESLEVTIKSRKVLPVQDGLLTFFSSQLKRAQVRYWNKNLYHRLDWNNLTELEILEGHCSEVFTSFELMTAPQLYKLHIRLDSSCQDLSIFFQCINRFPNLQHLSILVTDEFTVNLRQKIFEVPLSHLTFNRITTIEVFCRSANNLQDIPILFPLVRNLSYHYGSGSEELKNSFAEDGKFHFLNEGIPIFYNKPNVWSFLPLLETLELDYKGSLCQLKTRKFSRFSYTWETGKYKRDHEIQLKKVQEVAKRQLRESLQNDRCQSVSKTKQKTKNVPKSKLHEQVLPFVLPKLAEADILSCRLVSTAWWKLVGDSVLERNKHNILYKFEVPENVQSEDMLQAYIRKNESTPFFTRNVQITLMNYPVNKNGVKSLLNLLGKHVQYLTLAAGKNVVLTVSEAYKLCVECMEHCPNIRSFAFSIPIVANSESGVYQPVKEINIIQKPRRLEHLSFSGPLKNYELGAWALSQLMKHLEKAFHLQLKTLTQTDCQKYGDAWWLLDAQFTNLKEYSITKFNPEGTSRNFQWNITTENSKTLEKLCLHINVPGMTIENFRPIGKVFPNLKVLELQLGSQFFGLNKSLINSNPSIIIPVGEVHLKFREKYQVSLDFLIHFPCVKNLRITYGKIESSENDTVYDNTSNKKSRGNILKEIPIRWPERDYIQLMKYFKDENKVQHDAQNVYASNIWNVLRRLQTIEIIYCGDGNSKNIQTFSRK